MTKNLVSVMGSLILLLILIIGCNTNSTESADMIIKNGKIWTANPEMPEAEALAIRDDKIIAIGTNSDIEAFEKDGVPVIDAAGKMIVPGFIDSHVHFIEGGFRLASVQLRDASTPEEFAKRIADFAKTIPAGTWITGGDWDHELWGGKLPQADWVDKYTPDNPVFVSRLDGHMALANSLTMKLAKVNAKTKSVEGGTIVKNKEGKPTGIFKDNAMDLIYPVMPDPPDEMKLRALKAAMDYVAMQGVTSVDHMGSWDDLQVFMNARDKNLLKTRIYASVPLSTWEKLADYVQKNGKGDKWLSYGGLKGFVDGSLGSHTAAFFEPYSDSPDSKGFFVNDYDDLKKWILNGDKNNLQAVIHAIGDSAISTLIDIFEQVKNENGDRDRRFRIEHAQHIARKDLQRFKKNKIIASMQPYHAIDDGRWAEKVIGPQRIKEAYCFRSLLDNNVILAFGSDWFVAPPTPLEGIYAAVTRRTLDGKNPDGWVPEQKISVEEALRAYTIDAAFASFEEDIKGSLEKGKLADLVILDKNLFEIPDSTIKDVHVDKTILGGKIIYDSH
ncbi:MAG: amidohydrolase family protein [Calditrichae bacterium]|nr:amidohydrolase family protein [Calditrichota bacterium]MCB9058767.1 amidohydrolase family protein [Calditrichia bacterium]